MQIVFSNFDSPGNPWYNGGGALAIHEVSRRLAARGHTVAVLVGRFSGCQDAERDGVRYRHAGAAWAGPRLGQLLFQCLLPWQVRRGGFSHWVESLFPPFSTACLQVFTPRPVIALTQILAGRAMAQHYHLPFDRLERAGLRTYRHAIATSQFLRSELLRANPALQIAVIPNGTDGTLIHAPVTEHAGDHVLFLGRIAPHQKGIDLLLSAWAQVHSRLGLPLILAGSGTPREEARLRNLIAHQDLGTSVQWVGRVDGSRKQDLLRRARFLAMPSRFEASPLVAVEAFCHRLPVACFAIDELRELPDACTLKVAPFDTGALAAAMLSLATNPQQRNSMGAFAKSYARQFDWDSLAHAYEEFLSRQTWQGML